ADPILGAPKLARVLAASSPAGQQNTVDLPDQAIREGKLFTKARQPVVERSNVIGDFDHVLEWHARRLVQLEKQKVGKRGLRAFDLGGEDGLLADVAVKEERLVRQQGRDAVEPTERKHRGLKGPLQVGIERERRLRRQRLWHERANRLPTCHRHYVSARLAALHSAGSLFSKSK